jgi:hypothetical protein
MTNPSLTVVPAELSKRSKAIVEPLPQWPEAEPKALCDLDAAKNGAIALQEAADVLLDALGQGQRRWQALAQAVMGAAEAYQDVDESSASSLDFDNLGSPIEVKKPSVASSMRFDKLVPMSSRDYTRQKETLYHAQQKSDLRYHTTNHRFRVVLDEGWDSFVDGFFERQGAQFLQADELDKKFGDVKTVAQILKNGNQNASNSFRDQWSQYENQLRKLANRFKGFDDWDGEAATKVEKHFQRHIELINNLAGLCRTLSQNAQTVKDAYVAAEAEHPTLAQVEAVYKKLEFASKRTQTEYNDAMAELEKLQVKSQTALNNYRQKVIFSSLDKPAVPDRVNGDLFLTTEQISERNRKQQQEQLKRERDALIDDMTGGPGGITQPDAAALANSAGLGGPRVPSPQKLLSAVNQAASMAKGMGHKPAPGSAGTGLPPVDPHGPKVAPAAAMPGHGGGGTPSLGGGLGKAPLQPPSLPGGGPGGGPGVAAASFTPGAADANAVGRAAGAGGGMGGAPMGGMGAKGGQDGAGKSKRYGDDDSALYTEQRAWTEGIIGITPRKLGPTSKDG